MAPVNSEPRVGGSEYSEQVLTRISLALFAKNISGREVCRQLKKSHNWLNKRLSGEQAITLDDVSDIAGVLGVGVTELLGCRQSPAIHPIARDLDEVLHDGLLPAVDKDRILGILGEMIRWAYQRSEQAAGPPKKRRAAAPPPARAQGRAPVRKATPRKR